MDYKVMIKRLHNKMLLTQTDFAKEIGVFLVSVDRWKLAKMNQP